MTDPNVIMREQSVRGVKGRVKGMNAFLAQNLNMGAMGGGVPPGGFAARPRPSPGPRPPVASRRRAPAGPDLHIPTGPQLGRVRPRGDASLAPPSGRTRGGRLATPKRNVKAPRGRRLPSRRVRRRTGPSDTSDKKEGASTESGFQKPAVDPLPPSLSLGAAPILPMRSFMIKKGEKLDIAALEKEEALAQEEAAPLVRGPTISRQPTFQPRKYEIPADMIAPEEKDEEVSQLVRMATQITLTSPTLYAYDQKMVPGEGAESTSAREENPLLAAAAAAKAALAAETSAQENTSQEDSSTLSTANSTTPAPSVTTTLVTSSESEKVDETKQDSIPSNGSSYGNSYEYPAESYGYQGGDGYYYPSGGSYGQYAGYAPYGYGDASYSNYYYGAPAYPSYPDSNSPSQ